MDIIIETDVMNKARMNIGVFEIQSLTVMVDSLDNR